MAKSFESLDPDYVDALRRYVTEPLLKMPASDEAQKAGNPGALLADLRR